MTKAITTPAISTVGIDLGDRKSHLCVLDAEGEIIEESIITTTPKSFRARFVGLAPTRIALEVGTHSAWVVELLKELGHEVIAANARKLRMIFQNDSKNDRIDAQQLARVARMDPKLLYPIEHRARSARADLAIMRSRDALVTTRTRLINHIHGVLKSFGFRIKKYAARGFHRQITGQIPVERKPALAPLVKMLADISEQVSVYERELERLSKEDYPETALLSQVDRVGPITSLRYVLTIEDPGRIKKSRNPRILCRSAPQAGPIWQAGPGATYHQDRRSRAAALVSAVRTTNAGPFWEGFGPPAMGVAACKPRRSNGQEEGCHRCSSEAIGIATSALGDRRGLRSPANDESSRNKEATGSCRCHTGLAKTKTCAARAA